MGPECGKTECKCEGVYCPHCDTRLHLQTVKDSEGNEFSFARCSLCGCAWTGKPGESAEFPSLLCYKCALCRVRYADHEGAICHRCKEREDHEPVLQEAAYLAAGEDPSGRNT